MASRAVDRGSGGLERAARLADALPSHKRKELGENRKGSSFATGSICTARLSAVAVSGTDLPFPFFETAIVTSRRTRSMSGPAEGSSPRRSARLQGKFD